MVERKIETEGFEKNLFTNGVSKRVLEDPDLVRIRAVEGCLDIYSRVNPSGDLKAFRQEVQGLSLDLLESKAVDLVNGNGNAGIPSV